MKLTDLKIGIHLNKPLECSVILWKACKGHHGQCEGFTLHNPGGKIHVTVSVSDDPSVV